MLPEEQSSQVAICCCKPTDLEKALSKTPASAQQLFQGCFPRSLQAAAPIPNSPRALGQQGRGGECSVIVQRVWIRGTSRTDCRLKSRSREGEERQRPAWRVRAQLKVLELQIGASRAVPQMPSWDHLPHHELLSWNGWLQSKKLARCRAHAVWQSPFFPLVLPSLWPWLCRDVPPLSAFSVLHFT